MISQLLRTDYIASTPQANRLSRSQRDDVPALHFSANAECVYRVLTLMRHAACIRMYLYVRVMCLTVDMGILPMWMHVTCFYRSVPCPTTLLQPPLSEKQNRALAALIRFPLHLYLHLYHTCICSCNSIDKQYDTLPLRFSLCPIRPAKEKRGLRHGADVRVGPTLLRRTREVAQAGGKRLEDGRQPNQYYYRI